MKKLIALICIFSVLLTLCGCASEKQESPKATDNKIVSVSATPYFAVALKDDGSVVVSQKGDNDFKLDDFNNVKKVIADKSPTHDGVIVAALMNDGTVRVNCYYVRFGESECEVLYEKELSAGFDKMLELDNVIDIASTNGGVVALTEDGKVMAAQAYNTAIVDGAVVYNDQFDFSAFKNAKSITAGMSQFVGLNADGTVVAAGANHMGELNVTDWEDIVQTACANNITIGLKSDGTVITHECVIADEMLKDYKDQIYNVYGEMDFGDWTDIKAISFSGDHTVGLKNDGTVVAIGNNDCGQCDVSDWKDVVKITSCMGATYGLKADGTVISAGANTYSFN